MIVFTHRGLEPGRRNFYPEGSYEAFKDQIGRGFGIEFDPVFCRDGIAVAHDKNLKRITAGRDERDFSQLSLDEAKNIRYGKKEGRISSFKEILELIAAQGDGKINALHLKGINQTNEKIDALLKEIEEVSGSSDKILIFDLKPEFARYIREKNKEIKLAPSVAHEFDIERYNSVVSGTLLSMEEALRYKKEGLYDWVWLDEWDTLDKGGGEKLFCTKETFSTLRNAGYKIALVTPELHGTSPGLLGGEAHRDAASKESLFKRIKEIISLKPDAVCTDYPEEIKEM